MNLEKYWDIKNTDPKFGKFLNQSQFSEFFAVKRT